MFGAAVDGLDAVPPQHPNEAPRRHVAEHVAVVEVRALESATYEPGP